MRSVVLAGCVLLSVAGASAQTLQTRSSAETNGAPNPALSLPAGTKLLVRMDKGLDSSSAILGQSWTGTLVNDVVVGNRVALKSGTPVDGLVVKVKRGGHLRDSGELSIRLIRVNDGTVASDILTRDKEGHWKSGVTKIGGGTAIGALIGGLTGGPTGAVVGGAVGATGGTIAATTGGSKKQAEIPAEDVLTFTVQ